MVYSMLFLSLLQKSLQDCYLYLKLLELHEVKVFVQLQQYLVELNGVPRILCGDECATWRVL